MALDRRRSPQARGSASVAAIPPSDASVSSQSLRWGVVGTGSIAGAMAARIAAANSAELAAVSSRHLSSANDFADKHNIPLRFDDWKSMLASDDIDAIYVATPTSVREEICVAAALAGKHVLGEKPFSNLDSLKRITATCRQQGVVFMDGTHFVHHPRTAVIRQLAAPGWVWSVDSAFQHNLDDRSDIRFDPELEPYGAIGDAGWYNMRAALEFLAPDVELASTTTVMRRDPDTGAVISGSGVMLFDDGSTSTWNCGFDSGAVIMDLRISGQGACIKIDDFLRHKPDFSADYLLKQGGWDEDSVQELRSVDATVASATQMFDNVASLVGDAKGMEASILASERTQALLDAAWAAGVSAEAD